MKCGKRGLEWRRYGASSIMGRYGRIDGWRTRVHRSRPRSRLIASLLFMGFVALSACSLPKPAGEQASEALNAGLQAHVAGNLDQATSSYNECLKHEATNKLCLYNLGLIAQTQQRDAEAEDYYRRSLETDPQYAPSLFNLAIIRTSAGAVDEAVGLYQQVISMQPDNAAAHLNLGLLFLAQGKEDEATDELTTAVRLDPSLTSRVPSQGSSPEPNEATPSPS
jgi:tetratricopeptide (TPR) repeat protein